MFESRCSFFELFRHPAHRPAKGINRRNLSGPDKWRDALVPGLLFRHMLQASSFGDLPPDLRDLERAEDGGEHWAAR